MISAPRGTAVVFRATTRQCMTEGVLDIEKNYSEISSGCVGIAHVEETGGLFRIASLNFELQFITINNQLLIHISNILKRVEQKAKRRASETLKAQMRMIEI